MTKKNAWIARIGIAAWPAFVTAGVFTVTLFLFVDPHDLILISGLSLDRYGIYSLSFIIFWLFGTLCGGISAWLAYTSRPPSTHADRRK